MNNKQTYIQPRMEVLAADAQQELLVASLGSGDVPNILFDQSEVDVENMIIAE